MTFTSKFYVRHHLDDLEDVSLQWRCQRRSGTLEEQLTAPRTARSSPLCTLVPTATKSLLPDGVLKVSSLTVSAAFTTSLVVNSNLVSIQHLIYPVTYLPLPVDRRPGLWIYQFQRRGREDRIGHVRSYKQWVEYLFNSSRTRTNRLAPKHKHLHRRRE